MAPRRISWVGRIQDARAATRRPRLAPTDPPTRIDRTANCLIVSAFHLSGSRVIANRNEANPMRISPTRTKIQVRALTERDGTSYSKPLGPVVLAPDLMVGGTT